MLGLLAFPTSNCFQLSETNWSVRYKPLNPPDLSPNGWPIKMCFLVVSPFVDLCTMHILYHSTCPTPTRPFLYALFWALYLLTVGLNSTETTEGNVTNGWQPKCVITVGSWISKQTKATSVFRAKRSPLVNRTLSILTCCLVHTTFVLIHSMFCSLHAVFVPDKTTSYKYNNKVNDTKTDIKMRVRFFEIVEYKENGAVPGYQAGEEVYCTSV